MWWGGSGERWGEGGMCRCEVTWLRVDGWEWGKVVVGVEGLLWWDWVGWGVVGGVQYGWSG